VTLLERGIPKTLNPKPETLYHKPLTLNPTQVSVFAIQPDGSEKNVTTNKKIFNLGVSNLHHKP
jgi:hypothetical protein